MREALERAARARGLGDRVRFLGWRRDLAAIYAATDVFAITSRNEGTPVALIEAMAAGVASVSTDVGGVRDVILDETMGIVVPSGDAAALAAAITELVDDPGRRKRMGMEARRSVLARHTFARLTQQIAALYRELLRG
jgi:glycosyltransferase involved in cell wall biosynthesis